MTSALSAFGRTRRVLTEREQGPADAEPSTDFEGARSGSALPHLITAGATGRPRVVLLQRMEGWRAISAHHPSRRTRRASSASNQEFEYGTVTQSKTTLLRQSAVNPDAVLFV